MCIFQMDGLLVGNEKGKMIYNSKILNITHYDLDGCVCSIIISNMFDTVKTVPVSYNNLDQTILNVGKTDELSGYDVIITTDINLNKLHIDHLTNLGVIYFHLDHHEDSDHIENGRNIIVDQTKCGAMVTMDFMNINFKCDLSHLNNLILATDSYDRWIHNNIWGKPLNYIYDMYGFESFKNRFMKGFDPKELNGGEIEYLQRVNTEIQKELDRVKKSMIISDSSKIAIIYSSTKHMNDMSDFILKDKNLGVEIVFGINTGSFKCHMRTSRSDINLGKMLTFLGVGGGHKKAASFNNKNIVMNKTLTDPIKHDLIFSDIEKYAEILEKQFPDLCR